MKPRRACLALIALFIAASGCNAAQVTGERVEYVGEGTKVLFVGNSYRYYNDIPGIVQALADSAKGEQLAAIAKRSNPGDRCGDRNSASAGRSRSHRATIARTGQAMQRRWQPSMFEERLLKFAVANHARPGSSAGRATDF